MQPEKLGRYEIVGELGKGAMGLVYLAKDPIIGRELAIKTFRLGFSAKDSDAEQFKVRFLREAQSAGILSHPNIVTIHDVVVEDGGEFFIAMEYVRGTDLKRYVQEKGRLDPRFVVDIIAQIAEGLDYAHQKGVVHRDIKPANIILTAEKQAKITDFGIARVDASNLTVEGQLLGTPNYMAPEQIQGREVDHRADLFSLGVMLYEMLTGKKPFQGENLTVVTHKIVYDAFTPPQELVAGLPDRIVKVLDKALAKNPDDRYSRGSEMAEDLREVFTKTASSGTSSSFLGDLTPPGTGPVPTTASESGPQPTLSGQHAARQPYPVGPGTTSATRTGTLPGVPPPATARPPGGTAQASGGSKAMIGAIAALALVVLAGLGWVVLRPDGAATPAVEPTPVEKSEHEVLVEQGQQALDAGEPVRARELFDRALTFVPGDPDIRKLREQAEQAILDQGLGLDEAVRAIADGEFERAIQVVQAVLDEDPENERALELLAEAEDGQRRTKEARSRVQDRFTKRSAPPVEEAPPPAPPRATAPAAQATLTLEFASELPSGILSIHFGSTKVHHEQFTRGSATHQLAVPAGASQLRVYLWRSGETATVEHAVSFDADSVHALAVRVDRSGEVAVRLDGSSIG